MAGLKIWRVFLLLCAQFVVFTVNKVVVLAEWELF